ncbi:hypothetical protein ACH4ZX_36900 [Streptomyces sp. NPDC020490]|uniref:hypothetical protein n=1 Tax=Streptomyces sp. NPDC020490 TaxID=3365078 RepID=UPI0037AD541C
MTHSSYAEDVIGPDDVTFSDAWFFAGFFLFGIVAVAHAVRRLRKDEERSIKQGCVLAWCATMYLGLTLYAFVWALVHAIDNS